MREFFIAAMLNPSLKNRFIQELSEFSRIKNLTTKNKKNVQKIKTLKTRFL